MDNYELRKLELLSFVDECVDMAMAPTDDHDSKTEAVYDKIRSLPLDTLQGVFMILLSYHMVLKAGKTEGDSNV